MMSQILHPLYFQLSLVVGIFIYVVHVHGHGIIQHS